MDWIVNILLGVAANGVSYLLGYAINTLVGKITEDSKAAAPKYVQSQGLTQLIDDYVQERRLLEQERQAIHYRPHPQIVRHEVIIEERRASDDQEVWIILFAFLAAIVALATFWNTYKVLLFYLTVLGAGLGYASSLYLASILGKISGPHRIKDESLSWGSMGVWFFAILGLYLGVFHPPYSDIVVVEEDLSVSMVKAGQAVGAFCIYIAVAVTAILQFVAGSVYRKVLAGRPPNKFECFVWEYHSLGMFIIAISGVLGFLLVAGIFAR